MTIKRVLPHKLLSSSVKIVLINYLIILSASCNVEKQRILIEDISIEIPANWYLTKNEGIDSGGWSIISSSNDTIFIDYGKYSNSFNEIIEVRSNTRKTEYDSIGFKYPESMVFSETPEVDEAQGLYLKEYFYYDSVDGKKAKFGFPKKSGVGRCLLHVPNLDEHDNKLSMFVGNVDSETEKQVLEIFKSLRFNQKSPQNNK